MTRQTLVAASLAALLIAGCSKAREPLVEMDDLPKPPSSRVVNTGIGFRLADADEPVAPIEERKVAKGAPLGDAESARLFARLPKLLEQAIHTQDFSMPARSIPMPRPGTTIEVAFPPKEGPPPVEVTQTGPLQVVRFAPEGEVPLAPNVSLTFSEPMVP
ncbi:MAG TPA: hypothetical protein VGD74_00130, partial [Vulgatibacter sp.]